MSNADEPRRIVRALLPGEPIPSLSTIQLLLGVRCAVAIRLSAKADADADAEAAEARRRGGFKGGATRTRLAGERFHGHEQTLRELLEQAFTDTEIEEKIEINRSAIRRYILADPELKALSVRRREIRLARSKINLADQSRKITQAANDRFEARLPKMRKMIKQGRTNVYISAKLGICQRLVTRYITSTPELKALAEQRLETRMGLNSKKLAEIRGPVVEMRDAGMSKSAIARALDVGRGKLSKYMKTIEQENGHAEG